MSDTTEATTEPIADPALSPAQFREFLSELVLDERAVAAALAKVATNPDLHVGEVQVQSSEIDQLNHVTVQLREHSRVDDGDYDSGTYVLTVQLA